MPRADHTEGIARCGSSVWPHGEPAWLFQDAIAKAPATEVARALQGRSDTFRLSSVLDDSDVDRLVAVHVEIALCQIGLSDSDLDHVRTRH